MTELQKRRAALREKVEGLEKDADRILADVRDGKKQLEGETRTKLEQIELDLNEARKELAEIEQQEADDRLIADVESGLRYFSASRRPEERPDIPATERGRESFVELRNSHPAFRDWSDFGDFASAVARRAQGRGTDERFAHYQERAPSQFGELIDADGGILAPPQFTAQIMQRVYQTGQLMSRCRRIPMSSKKIIIPAIDESSRADGSRLGGVRAYWEGEGDATTPSKAKFREIKLEPKRLTCATHASEELLEDAPALASWIQMAFTEEITHMIEAAIFEGDGSGKPLGILKSPAFIAVPKEGEQDGGTIVPENIINARARVWGRSRPNMVWFNNQDTEPELMTLGLAVGTGGQLLWTPANGLSDAPFDRLFGRDLIPIEHCPTVGTVGDLVAADMQQYLLGQRNGVQSATSIHVKFLENEQTFRWNVRIDGQPWWHSALTPKKGSATQSPFVGIQTRS